LPLAEWDCDSTSEPEIITLSFLLICEDLFSLM